MFAICVEMWSASYDDAFDEEYVGAFFWSEGFNQGRTLSWSDPRAALVFLSENERQADIAGFDYRYHIQEIDNSDGAFGNLRDADSWM